MSVCQLTFAQGTFEEAEASFRSQIKILEEEISRQKVRNVSFALARHSFMSTLQRLMSESTKRYRREQELMLSAIHSLGMRTARDHLGVAQQQNRPGPTSWLGQQRKNVSSVSRWCQYPG